MTKVLSFVPGALVLLLGSLGCGAGGESEGMKLDATLGDGGAAEAAGIDGSPPGAITDGAASVDRGDVIPDGASSDLERSSTDARDTAPLPDAGDTSGFPRDRLVATLTAAEAARLCDWVNANEGGYGRQITCSDGRIEESDESLVTCVRDFLDLRPILQACQLTVGHMEDCSRAIGPDLCSLDTASECGPLRACAQ
jgi:hypothetical protein